MIRGRNSFPGLLYFTLDPYLIMLNVKKEGIKHHFLSLWYNSTCEWTPVSRGSIYTLDQWTGTISGRTQYFEIYIQINVLLSDYWLHIYCYTHKVSADMFFGLLQVFHAELGSPHGISLNHEGYLSLPPHQTVLDTRSMTTKVDYSGDFRGGGRSGTSRGLSHAWLCWSSTHLVQYGPDEPSWT